MSDDTLDVMEWDDTEAPEQELPEEEQAQSFRQRHRKKRLKKRWIALGLAVLLVGFLGIRGYVASKTLPTVEAYEVTQGDLRQIVSISGTVVTDEEKGYFAKVTVPVETLHVSVGDTVKKGDLLITYDPAKLELAKQTASLGQNAQTGNYDNSMQQEAKNRADFAEANTYLPILEQQVDFINDWIQEISLKITEKQQRMNQTYMELQQAYTDELNSTNPDKDKLNTLQRLQHESQLAQNNDPEINAWRKQIEDLQQELVKFQENKAEMDSQQKTSEASLMNPGAINALNANQQSNTLQTQDTLQDLTQAQEGIRADFNGVVTEIGIREGATPTPGMELVHLSSTEKSKVQIQITKADLEKVRVGQDVVVTVAGRSYDGQVSKIAGNATRNSSGMAIVAGEVMILDPDEGVILGAEADADIHTGDANGAVILPYEYINSDSRGDFVYAVVDGVIQRQEITIGITTDMAVEILSGLTPGTLVTSSLPAGVQEGTKVETVPVSEKSQDMMMQMMINNF